MTRTVVSLCDAIGELAAELGLEVDQRHGELVLPAEAIALLRDCLQTMQRARVALERSLQQSHQSSRPT